MFRRILFFTACLGVFAAVAAAGVLAKDGFKITLTLDPVPPATQTTLAFNCEVTFEGKVAYIDCHNAEPNPFPPKDEKTVTVREGTAKLKLTAYPDGEVVLTARLKASQIEA